ncbi:hypothetical protein SAMN05519103_09488 [Rhizobiales bacterium GAS113]|nr:hypothetical protein SAMN05519103_09488 [Rhizobiales bacterium GAS113]
MTAHIIPFPPKDMAKERFQEWLSKRADAMEASADQLRRA